MIVVKKHKSAAPPPQIGVSGCLLGQEIRYDGRHKSNTFITTVLAQQFDLVPFCPEVAIGLGVPRPPIQLVTTDTGIRVRGVADASIDVTEQLTDYAHSIKPQLDPLSGYIFTARSPSCGLENVRLVDAENTNEKGTGIFAATVKQLLPGLPLIEDEQLDQTELREKFLADVNKYHQQKFSDR